MKSVARRVTLSLAEAKRFSVINEDFNPSYLTSVRYRYTVRNIFFPIPVASGANAGSSYAREGSEIVDPLLKLKWTFRIFWPLLFQNGNYGSVYFHVYIISTNETYTFPGGAVSVYPDLTPSNDPGWFIQVDGVRPTLNGNNIRVLKAWHRKVSPTQLMLGAASGVTPNTFGNQDISGSMTYRWKRKLTYEDSSPAAAPNFPSSGLLRGMNYYILCGWSMTGTTLPTAARPDMRVDSFLYFKDP